MNTWMRGFSAWRTASHARSTSLNPVRDSAAIVGPCTPLAMASTASKSPWLAIGNPASMMSTPRRASWSAISSFSPTSREIPGDCSPSRRVVSKMIHPVAHDQLSCSQVWVSVAFRGNEKPPRPEGTRRRPRAPGGARDYVRRRPVQMVRRRSFVIETIMLSGVGANCKALDVPSRRSCATMHGCGGGSSVSSAPVWWPGPCTRSGACSTNDRTRVSSRGRRNRSRRRRGRRSVTTEPRSARCRRVDGVGRARR